MMERRAKRSWKLVGRVGTATALITIALIAYINRPRVLAEHTYDDGTSQAVVAEPRLLGLMGIGTVLEDRAADGSVQNGSVQDLLGSWDEVLARYKNPAGGGLLRPVSLIGLKSTVSFWLTHQLVGCFR